MRSTIVVALLVTFPLQAGELFRDDFSAFPPGWLSQPIGQLNGAIQEYHYLPHRGLPLGVWANPIVHEDAWVAGDEEGNAYLEQHLFNDRPRQYRPLLVTGDEEWSDYTVEVRVKPLSLRDLAGIVFRYQTNTHNYVFGLRGGTEAVLQLRLPIENEMRVANWRDLAAAPFCYDVKKYYHLRVENDGPRIRAYVDGSLLLEVMSGELKKGKAGLTASVPARYQRFIVSAPDPVEEQIRKRIAARQQELSALRAANPQPRLWRRFPTPGFGAGRNVRFGDLNGDGQTDMLIAQNIPRVRGDAFDHISCLTAVTLEGRVLWQIGRPDPRNGLLTNDTPFQIHDIDGDGASEVILVKDFQLQIREGKDGRLRQAVWMPPMHPGLRERPYELNSGDSIAFLNLSGQPERREILVKDRYRHFWIYNQKLELLWQGEGQTGHYPYPYDVDGDGKEEFLIGYALWRHDGKQIWSRDNDFQDHADGIVMGNFSGDPQAAALVYACGSDEGFLMFDAKGRTVKHHRIGHAQSPSIGKYRPDIPGLQLLTVNFWRNPGVLSLFDAQGNLLGQAEPIHSGSPLLPVNWRGDGVEFAMLSANPREGGLIDGFFRRVVMFPDDGHPDLTYAVLNLTGDPRDEIVVWDQREVWIYTQDRPFRGSRIYAPRRNPEYNESNYRTTVSEPAWREWR